MLLAGVVQGQMSSRRESRSTDVNPVMFPFIYSLENRPRESTSCVLIFDDEWPWKILQVWYVVVFGFHLNGMLLYLHRITFTSKGQEGACGGNDDVAWTVIIANPFAPPSSFSS